MCEYKYYMDVGQFRHLDRPISVEADVEVICESSKAFACSFLTYVASYLSTVTCVEARRWKDPPG